MTEKQVKKGLTWRTWLALVFGLVVLQPAIIYFYLLSGMGLPVSTWIIILIMVMITNLSGKPMSPQETFIIMAFGSVSLAWGWYFINPIKSMYYSVSPITAEFGIAQHIPSWWAPAGRTALDIFVERAFFHPAWLVPLAIGLLQGLLLIICDISLGLITYQIYAVTEKLEFPMQTAGAESIVALTNVKSDEFRTLILSLFGGIVYNFVSWFVPFILGNPMLQLIPRGLIDVTRIIETSLPGAMFGVTTDVFIYLIGFVLPIPVAISMFIGAMAVYFFGNYYVTLNNMWPTEVAWSPGLDMATLTLRSQLYFWFSLSIGLALAATIIPLAIRPQKLINAFKSLSEAAKLGQPGMVHPLKLLGLFLGAAIFGIVLVHILVPDFPWWILILFSVGWSLFFTFVSTYSSGVTFGGFGVPYLRETTIYYSGYKNMDIWFAPIMISGGGPFICGSLKQADICETSINEFIKAYIVVILLGLVMSFFYVSLFWKMSPIPGSAYPYTVVGWPVETMAWGRWFRWLWTGYLFNAELIIYSFIMGGIIYLASDFLLHKPYLLIALVSGIFMPPNLVVGPVTALVGGKLTMATIATLTQQVVQPTFWLNYGPIPTTLAQLTGSFVSRYVLEKRYGKENWRRMAPLIVIGFGVGDSIMFALSWGMLLTTKSLWLLPY